MDPTPRELEVRQELAHLRQEFDEFVYIISHDLKAPLRGIASLSEWLKTDYSDSLDEEGQEMIELIESRVKRLQRLLDGVLEYSRLNRRPETLAAIDLGQMVSTLINQLNPPDAIKIIIEDNPLPTIQAEPSRIAHLFSCLLDNAIRHVNPSTGQIVLNWKDQGDHWEFSLSDNGPGIEQKDFERIFKIFQTLQPPDQTETAGVGLTLAKKIVNLHGGDIWLESTPGHGATFYFTLLKQQAHQINK